MKVDPLILGIETGTGECAVALFRGAGLIGVQESTGGGNDHARKLAVYIERLLKDNEVSFDELDAVAVSKGPGSYTGLRIGVSTAKGLCYALGIPLIAIGSLESLANVAVQRYKAKIFGMPDMDARLCPMIDARRMEVYTRVFDASVKSLSETSAEIVTPESFSEYIGRGHEFFIFGTGASKCVDVLPREGVTFLEVSASAHGLVKPAYEAFIAGRFEDIAYFEPYYLKDFIITASGKKYF